MIIVLITNKYYHVEIHDNHHHQHHHENSLIDSHEIATELSVLHYIEHIDAHKNIGILGTFLLLLVFLKSVSLNLVSPLLSKIIQLRAKITFCRYLFVDPPPTPLRSMLFHAPPK